MKLPFAITAMDANNTMESTSLSTAKCPEEILFESESIKFSFLPQLVDNSKDRNKSVSGKFVYEKKSKNDKLFPTECDLPDVVNKKSVKVGHFLELTLDTSNTFQLYKMLQKYYAVYRKYGIPVGSVEVPDVDELVLDDAILDLLNNDKNLKKILLDGNNIELLKKLINIVSESINRDSVLDDLDTFNSKDFNSLAATLNLARLKRLSHLISENLNNDSEEFWQKQVFGDNEWVLSLIFSLPYVMFGEKMYMGGKQIFNNSGNICDFIYQNHLTDNIALVEIKNPCTRLIGGNYRQTFSLSSDLSGAINQVLNYKDNVCKEYYTLSSKTPKKFTVFSPKCFVIIGTIKSLNCDKLEAFETFRNNMTNVSIITFDEILELVDGFIDIMENHT